MKRIALALAFAGLAASAFADETVEVYRQIYADAEGLSQKYAAALNLVRLQDKSVAPVLGAALEELVRTQSNYAAPADRELYARTVRVVAQALGDYKYDDAAPFLWDVVQQNPDPLARAEALIALGKMRALAYAERISLLLRDLNMGISKDKDSDEKVAYGAILSLEKLKDIRGFSPVFFASQGWYSLRVRQQAAKSLPNIVDDPTEPIAQIVAVESPGNKVIALQAELASKAASDKKGTIALQALVLGQKNVPADRNEAKVYADLRKLALRGLVSLKVQGPDPVDACVASYQGGLDDEERLLALAALGANGTDPAAAALRDIILKLNADQRSGLNDETRIRMARAAIENAGLTKNKIVKPALVSVASNDKWSGSVILAAQNAIKAIP